MEDKIIITAPPSAAERKSLRLMLCIGVFTVVFFLYSMLQQSNISYLPLYLLLMTTLVYYCCKYLHEWYHYFSISTTPKPIASRIYTVDILTTYCAGEPFDMLQQTLEAMQKITYPHTSWCCDEANDPQVKQLCAQLGVRHVTRIIKNDAKAGNINNALQLATGELCLVLDPDHIPVPGILDEIVPYFENTSIGFVQIVQAYYNQTETLVAKGAAQQTYQFYGPVMMTMNSYGTVQAIGANCTFRRAALDSIGGHASGLAEDMHTAMQLHAKGWQSVYVPAILTRGLVPATMSSYYKQQLKWSRGTWELFVKVFPTLFRRFTWRQRIHYFTIPFHYLSGLIFLINFLIPVVSLFTGYVPLTMDVLNFLLATMPLFFMGIFIRHYVQKWVAEETERGFHIVGGILQIGTWWIHSMGFIYTLFRKKVPYIPTPKNDSDSLPLMLSIPNILIAVISLLAIVYGFWHDYTPYTVFMAVLAGMQIIFMAFILSISGYVRDNSKLNQIASKIRERNGFIILTHGFVRKYSVPLSIAVIIIFVFAFIEKQRLPKYLPKPLPALQVFYRGVDINNDSKGQKSNSAALSNALVKNDIRIVAMNILWPQNQENVLDTAALRTFYAANTIPLLQWDLQVFKSGDSLAWKQITDGRYDTSIQSLAVQLAQFNRPVFLLPVRNAGASQLLPFAMAAASKVDVIKAWQHMHDIFENAGAVKVIWVWQPPAASSMKEFFPGNKYVDWMAVQLTAADAAPYRENEFGFDSVYRPYHQLPFIQSTALPVMITGATPGIGGKTDWWKAAWKSIDTGFTEIKAVIASPDPQDANGQVLLYNSAQGIQRLLTGAPSSKPFFPHAKAIAPVTASVNTVYNLSGNLKGVVYNKGYSWFRNRHTLDLRTIEEDITAMKLAGINTVERRMPGFYDNKLQQILLANGMNLVPRCWLQATPQVIADDAHMQKETEKILSFIQNNLAQQNIIAWNLGEDVLYELQNQTYKPDYFYYEHKYMVWLANLCTAIRKIDNQRPIIIDLHWNAGGPARYRVYKSNVPQINIYMVEADEKYPEGLQLPLQENMRWGKVPVALWPLLPAVKQSAIVPAWQDLANTNFISLNGILDMDGRKKQDYKTVVNTWTNQHLPPSGIPDTKILRPAAVTKENLILSYQLIFRQSGLFWTPYDQYEKNIRFEWYLVRVDQYGNTMFIKKIGEGKPYLKLQMPADPQFYQLYAAAILGDNVAIMHASLNTPLESN